MKTTVAVLLALACVACAVDASEHAPPLAQTPLIAAQATQEPTVPGYYTVALSPTLSDAQVTVTLDAIDRINALLGFAGFRPVVATLSAPRPWWITVSDAPEFIDTDIRGWSGGVGLECEVRLHREAFWNTVAHEMAGHCVDLPHDEETPNDYMAEIGGAWSTTITDEQLAAIRDRVKGLR